MEFYKLELLQEITWVLQFTLKEKGHGEVFSTERWTR